MFKDLLEYAEWYYYEEDYFISEQGNLLAKYPDEEIYNIVVGIRYTVYLSYEQNIKPYDNGKPIVTVPREIAPIYDWDVY